MEHSTKTRISRSDLQDDSNSPEAFITDVKQLSSYSWVEASKPTIVVPGIPPLWSPPQAPQRVKKDSGLVYIAENAARHPESPIEPLFRALFTSLPSFDIESTDVVSDRNNIRKLLSFVDPGSTREAFKPFTIKVEVVKDTVIFCREDSEVMDFIDTDEFKGYNNEFEKAYTSNQIKGSTGHYRVISYCFNGLNFIIRHDTDGYVASKKIQLPPVSKENDKDDLSDILDSLSLSTPKVSSGNLLSGSKLTLKEEGQLVELDSTLKIKTRVRHKPIPFEEIAAQMWISQTPKLVRAYHTKGVFVTPEAEDITAKIKDWEKRKQSSLRKLAMLIARIIKAAKCYGRATVKYDDKRDRLVIQKAEVEHLLPKDLYSRWEDKSDKPDDGKEVTETGSS